MQKARMEYLHEDNLRNKKKVQQYDESHARLLRVAMGKEEQSRMLREMAQRYETYEKRRKEKESAANPERSDAGKKTLPREKSPPGVNTSHHRTTSQLLDVKTSKRVHHPSSKILITTEERQKDFLGLAPNIVDPKLMKRANEDPKEYLLQIRSALPLKNKKLFSKYYSGGPPEYEYESNSVSFFLIVGP